MTKADPNASLLSSSLTSASSLVLLQLFSRLFTFALNQALVRLVSPQVFGTAAIQFELLLSTVLFLSREGVRNALLRADVSTTDANTNAKAKSNTSSTDDLTQNIALLPLLASLPLLLLLLPAYTSLSPLSTTSQPHFTLSLALYVIAALLELAAEPLYVRAMREMKVGVRVRAEGRAVVGRCVGALGVVLAWRWLAGGGGEEGGLVAFAVGQVVYGAIVLGTFMGEYGFAGGRWYWMRGVDVDVHGNTKRLYFDQKLLQLAGAMTWQSVMKHFLTEGDKFVVARFSPLADQGGYAIASNYGSLVARIIFQPIEETSRIFFSKTLSAPSSDTSADDKDTSASRHASKQALETASNILTTLLLLFTHLLLLLLTFAPPYLPLLLTFLLPPRYHHTSAPSILHTYIYYIPMMAYNGVLEAFFAATASPADLRAQSRWLIFCSGAFVFGAVGCAKGLAMGDRGLVWANIGNLGMRAAYAWVYARRYFGGVEGGKEGSGRMRMRVGRCVPPVGVLGVFAVCAAVVRLSAGVLDAGAGLKGQVGHVGVGIACVAVCLGACFVLERAALKEVVTLMRRR